MNEKHSMLTVHMRPPSNMSGRQLEVGKRVKWQVTLNSWESQYCRNLPVTFVLLPAYFVTTMMTFYHVLACLTLFMKDISPLPIQEHLIVFWVHKKG